MNESWIRSRSAATLVFAVALAIAAGTLSAPEAGAGRARTRGKESSKVCYYGSGIYSLGACYNGKECVRGVNDEDYWETTSGCSDQTSPGTGGRRQV